MNQEDKPKWRPVIIESPFKGTDSVTEDEHRAYLERCIKECILRGETPYASHKMLTDALDDSDPGQRRIGINAGLAMAECLLKTGKAYPVFYVDYGMSDGMKLAEEKYRKMDVTYFSRTIGKNA